MTEDEKPGASDPKLEGVRPASTREAVHGVKQTRPNAGSFDSVVLGPDLGPSPKADPELPVIPRSVAPQARGQQPAEGEGTAPGGQAAPVRPKPVAPQARAQQLAAGDGPRASGFVDQVTDKNTIPPVGLHDAPTNLNVEEPAAAVGAALSSFGDLPADFAARTLIASADPRPIAQPARDRVQISAREVAAELQDPRLIMIHEPDSERAATFRILRHRLVERGHPRTILVSSARAGDGKTLLAANLALALSECGRARVLLVEANLRQPHLARMLGFRPPRCFAEQLASHKTSPMDPWMVAQVSSPWLHVAAIDYTTFDRPQVIDGPALEGGLDQLKRVQYDYLVLDTPPVLGNADVNLVQDAADAVLLAAWARRTTTRDLQRAIDQLTPSKVVGVALLEV